MALCLRSFSLQAEVFRAKAHPDRTPTEVGSTSDQASTQVNPVPNLRG